MVSSRNWASLPWEMGRLCATGLVLALWTLATGGCPAAAKQRSRCMQASAVSGKGCKPDLPVAHVAPPFWASNSLLSFGLQVAYGIQMIVPPNGSHINLLYAQPQLAITLRNFAGSRFESIQLVNEGMLGGAVNPGGRVLGYTALFRLEGRTRRNTKPLLDWGGGVIDTTLSDHAYELNGHLQFNPQAGIGFEHFFSPQRAFVVEYRFLHLSNAGIVGPNKGVQCSVLTVGFRWLRR